MIKVAQQFFHYEIEGEREAEAAERLEERIDFISRSPLSSEEYIQEESDIVEKIRNDYGVTIKAVFQ